MYENTMANSANMNGVYLMARSKEHAPKLSDIIGTRRICV